jgi:glucose-1-phosphate thymidylyltransferase
MKGIVLAGGTGSRLWPVTKSVSKQLLPLYDKPLIYYPISSLMLAGVREILIITTPKDQNAFKELLEDGSKLGITFTYAVQAEPKGLAQAFIIAKDFLKNDSCLMILGDNIFEGFGLGHELRNSLPDHGAHIFTYEVSDPTQYGILTVDENDSPLSVAEKPQVTSSTLAITGLYYFDNRVSKVASNVIPSKRGELEITSIIDFYLQEQNLSFTQLPRGTVWLDTGNPKSMHDAATYVRVMEERTGLKIACLEEIAFNEKLIDELSLKALAESYGSSQYGSYLRSLLTRR